MNGKILSFGLILLGVGAAALWTSSTILPKNLETITPRTGPAIEVVYATGTVEPSIMVPIAPRGTARLTSLSTNEGQRVTKGDILAQLEDTDVQAAIVDLTSQMDFARADYRRKQELFKDFSVSKEVLESAKAKYESLTAQLNKAKAEASYLTLIAPADGLIIKRDGEVGELIASGQAVFYMSCCAPLRITSEVDEEDIPQIKTGQSVLIQSDAFPDTLFHGKVSAITPKGDPVARSYRVRISFDDTDIPLMIGMTTETNIIIEQHDTALLIPATSVSKDKKVQLVRDNRIENIAVQTGIETTTDVEILSGLKPDDVILTSYAPGLKDGQKINPAPAHQARQESSP